MLVFLSLALVSLLPFKRLVHSCLQAPQFNEAFGVGLVETGFDVVVCQVLIVERHWVSCVRQLAFHPCRV